MITDPTYELTDPCPNCGIDGMQWQRHTWNTRVPIHWTGSDEDYFDLNGRHRRTMCMVCGFNYPHEEDVRDLKPVPRKVRAARWGEWKDGELHYPTLTTDDHESAELHNPSVLWHPSQDLDHYREDRSEHELDPEHHVENDEPELRWSAIAETRRALADPPLVRGPAAVTDGQHHHIVQLLIVLREMTNYDLPDVNEDTLDGLRHLIGPSNRRSGWSQSEASEAIELLTHKLESVTNDPIELF